MENRHTTIPFWVWGKNGQMPPYLTLVTAFWHNADPRQVEDALTAHLGK